ncbi:hypothetical protein D3C73_1561210 [compost metagenome]
MTTYEVVKMVQTDPFTAPYAFHRREILKGHDRSKHRPIEEYDVVTHNGKRHQVQQLIALEIRDDADPPYPPFNFLLIGV